MLRAILRKSGILINVNMVKSENMRKNVMIYVIFLLMDNWKWYYNSLLHLLQFLKKKYLNKHLICEIKIDEV